MTDNTQELDEKIGNIIDDLVNTDISARFHNTDWAEYRIKQALLDWQNKQVEAMLDRLEQSAVKYGGNNVMNVGVPNIAVPLSAIEIERIKLKEAK